MSDMANKLSPAQLAALTEVVERREARVPYRTAKVLVRLGLITTQKVVDGQTAVRVYISWMCRPTSAGKAALAAAGV